MAKKFTGLMLDEELIVKLRKLAEQDDRTMSSLIRRVLNKYADEHPVVDEDNLDADESF